MHEELPHPEPCDPPATCSASESERTMEEGERKQPEVRWRRGEEQGKEEEEEE